MANNNVAKLVKALPTVNLQMKRLQRGVPGDGGGMAPRDECFTATELAAAEQLVMLSESSSEDVVLQEARRSSSAASSSSIPSVSNAWPPPPDATTADEDEDGGISTGPSVRKQRYRSIRSLYKVTSPIDVDGKRRSAAQSRRKNRTIRGFPLLQ